MANEIRVNSNLSINKGSLRYSSLIRSFTADMEGQKGPTPGAFDVSVSGTDVDLSQFTTPGIAELANLSEDYHVEFGIYEPATGSFYPLGELLPGESYVFRFSRNVKEQFDGTVTGTGTWAENNTVRFKSYGGTATVYVGAFEA